MLEKGLLKELLKYLNLHPIQARLIIATLCLTLLMLSFSFSISLLIQSYHGCFGDILKALTLII